MWADLVAIIWKPQGLEWMNECKNDSRVLLFQRRPPSLQNPTPRERHEWKHEVGFKAAWLQGELCDLGYGDREGVVRTRGTYEKKHGCARGMGIWRESVQAIGKHMTYANQTASNVSARVPIKRWNVSYIVCIYGGTSGRRTGLIYSSRLEPLWKRLHNAAQYCTRHIAELQARLFSPAAAI